MDRTMKNQSVIASRLRVLPILATAGLLAACVTATTESGAASAEGLPEPVNSVALSAESTPESRGLAFATTHCSGCHAIVAGQVSPNPESPPFETVANMPGLTSATLDAWLRDSHNFPPKMDFSVAPDEVDDLVAYLVTLKSGDYRPPIQ